MILLVKTKKIRRTRNAGISIMDTVNINKSVGSYTPKKCAMDIWKEAVWEVVAQIDTQNPVNGLEDKWDAKEKKSVTSLMILVHSMIRRLMHTKRKVTLLDVLVVNLNGRKVNMLCNTRLRTENCISVLIVRIGYGTRKEFSTRDGLCLTNMGT